MNLKSFKEFFSRSFEFKVSGKVKNLEKEVSRLQSVILMLSGNISRLEKMEMEANGRHLKAVCERNDLREKLRDQNDADELLDVLRKIGIANGQDSQYKKVLHEGGYCFNVKGSI